MRKLIARTIALVCVSAALAVASPANARWGVTDNNVAVTASGDTYLLYVCTRTDHAFRIVTPIRLPMIGTLPNMRRNTTYRVDGGRERPAALFLRSQDVSKPEYLYTLVLEVNGLDTRIDDVVRMLQRGNRLTLDMWARDVEFSLEGSRAALNRARRSC